MSTTAIRIYMCQRCGCEFTDESAWHKKTIVTDPTGQEHLHEQNIPVCPQCHIANYTLQFRAKPPSTPAKTTSDRQQDAVSPNMHK